jgi:hypothetical protein
MVVKQSFQSQKGVGLVLALMMLFLLSLLGAAVLTATTVDIWISDNYRTANQLLYLTETGIEDGREALGRVPPGSLIASAIPFIKDKPLVDSSGREAGIYSVALTRLDPLTLRSMGTVRNMRKTIEVQLTKSGFPAGGSDPRLNTPAGAERIVEGIVRNATDVFSPRWNDALVLGAIGSPEDYRVVVVNGDCQFGNAAGFGLLVVRGNLLFQGNFTWNGLIVVIGQGSARVTGAPISTTGWITGGLFLSRTRGPDRSEAMPLGTLLDTLGSPTVDWGGNTINLESNAVETRRANERFPYVPVSYREY